MSTLSKVVLYLSMGQHLFIERICTMQSFSLLYCVMLYHIVLYCIVCINAVGPAMFLSIKNNQRLRLGPEGCDFCLGFFVLLVVVVYSFVSISQVFCSRLRRSSLKLSVIYRVGHCIKRNHQGSSVLLYFALFAFSRLCLVFVVCLFLICLLSRIFQHVPTWMALYSLILLMCC